MEEWDKEKYQMLVPNTVMCAEAQMGRNKGTMKVTERTKFSPSLICRGKIRAAIRYACEREKGAY